MNKGLVINDYFDLLNLHKALLEAKFHENPDNANVSGSPIIARICNDIVTLLSQYDIEKRGKEHWTQWRHIKSQDLYKERVLEKIVKISDWNSMDIDKKKQILNYYISPFTCNADEILELIEEADAKFNRH